MAERFDSRKVLMAALAAASLPALSCKARQQAATEVKAAPGRSAPASEQLAYLLSACEGSKASRFIGRSESGGLVYWASENARASGRDFGPLADYKGEAKFEDGVWKLSVGFDPLDPLPLCVTAGHELGTEALAFALGCSTQKACAGEGDEVTASGAQAAEGLRLVDGAPNGVTCVRFGDGYLPHRNGTPLGNPENALSLRQCESILSAKTANGALCVPGDAGFDIVHFAGEEPEVKRSGVLTLDRCLALAAEDALPPKPSLRDQAIYMPSPADSLLDAGGKEAGKESAFALAGNNYGFLNKSCESAEHNYHLVKTYGGRLCYQPDTLYSWGPQEKISFFQRLGFPSGTIRNYVGGKSRDYPIFGTHSPYSTFGYGTYNMRIKIRSGVTYKIDLDNVANPYDMCSQLGSAVDSTVIVRYWDNSTWAGGNLTGVDYIICSMNVVDSWSIGEKEFLAEVTRETTHMNRLSTTLKVENHFWYYEMYVKKKYWKGKVGVDAVYPDGMDAKRFSAANFQRTMAAQADYSPSIYARDAGAKERHFSTDTPDFFNPD